MGSFSKLFFFALGILGSHRDFPVATPTQQLSAAGSAWLAKAIKGGCNSILQLQTIMHDFEQFTDWTVSFAISACTSVPSQAWVSSATIALVWGSDSVRSSGVRNALWNWMRGWDLHNQSYWPRLRDDDIAHTIVSLSLKAQTKTRAKKLGSPLAALCPDRTEPLKVEYFYYY